MSQTELRQPELRHRIAAAAGASVVSALLVNPLDVVKTRVQAASIVTDRPLPTCLLSRFPVRWARPFALSECQPALLAPRCTGPAGSPASAASSTAAASAHAPHLSGRGSLPAMSLSSACACALPQRVADLGPEVLTVGRGPGGVERCGNARSYRPVTAWGVLRDILRKEGAAALWRGTDTAMLASIPMVGVYMPLYDYLLVKVTPPRPPAAAPTAPAAGGDPAGAATAGWGSGYAPLVAGSAARTLAVLLVAPLELVRTRQQGSERGARTAWAAVAETLRDTGAAAGGGGGGGRSAATSPSPSAVASGTAGWGAALRAAPRLWTGVGATLARDVPFSAIYWGLVEGIRGQLLARWGRESLLQQHHHHHQRQQQEHRPVGHSSLSRGAVLAANLIAGSAAGTVAALVTTPFDVVKTQLQMGDVRGGGGRAGGIGGGGDSGGRPSVVAVARRILREEGAAGLFRGWAPRAARTAPACAVVVASYEVLKMVL